MTTLDPSARSSLVAACRGEASDHMMWQATQLARGRVERALDNFKMSMKALPAWYTKSF